MKDPIGKYLVEKKKIANDYWIQLDEIWIGSNINISGYKSCFYNFENRIMWLKLINNPFLFSYKFYCLPYDSFNYKEVGSSFPNGQFHLEIENITLALGYSKKDRERVRRCYAPL